MNCRVNKLVFASMGAVCLVLLAGQSASAQDQKYQGYPVFWGKSNALKRQSGTIGKANTQPERAASVRTGSGNKIEKVSYTEFERTGGVITETIVPAETIIEGNVITEGEVIFEGGYDDCSACGGDGCGLCGGGCLEGICHGLLQRSEFSFGVQGFKGPLDDGENANFGFQQGVNFGFALLPSYGIGGQIGATFTQSDLHGYEVDGIESKDARTQQFLTIGVFERATDCCALQWGIVFDWMKDEFVTDVELTQLRGEIGYLFNECSEVGFWFTASDDDDLSYYSGNQGSRAIWAEPTDMYAFYYRHTACEGNELRVWGGFTDNSDGLLGGDFQVPLSDRLALRGAANYLIPSEEKGYDGSREESWGMGVSVVWYPGRRARCASTDLFAPLLRPADNTTFMVDAWDVE